MIPISGGLRRQRALQFALVMDFDQRRHTQLADQRVQVGQLGIFQRGDDQQDRVCSGRASLVHLIRDR